MLNDLGSPLARVARWLDASPAEVAGLALLLLGAVAVAAVSWWAPPAGRLPASEAAAAPVTAPTGLDAVTVHVAGAIARPGLIALPVGSRVAAAIEAAGGVTLDGDLDGLNLAREVTDGERIEVPRLGEVAGEAAAAGAWQADGRLDLNRATADDLEELPGVGEVLARRILDWREAHGPFVEVGQLREVSGIGERTFQTLAELVAV